MSRFVFADFVNTVLAAAVNTTQLTISVSSATNIPLVATGQQYALVVMDSTQSLFEVMYVTGVSGTTLTVLRGQEGTTAQSWITGDAIYGCMTAGVATRLIQRIRQQQTLSASTVLASSSSGQSVFTSGALTTTLPSATEPGINNTIFGNGTGAVTVTTGVIPPGPATLSSVAGGTLAATTYYVKTTFVTAQGQETLPSAEQSIAVVADDLLTVVNASATGTQAATWNLYVGTTSGGETLQASGLVLGATWTEPTTGITTTGNTYPTTQNGYIITPDGTQQTSYTLAESNVAGMSVESDGANYRAKTFGPTIVSPATAANQAVNQSQVANATPPGSGANSGSATTLTATSGTYTAPSTGTLLIMGYGQSGGTANGGTGISASLAAPSAIADFNVGGANAFEVAVLPMTAGQATTISFNFTTSAAVSMDSYVYSVFIPLP